MIRRIPVSLILIVVLLASMALFFYGESPTRPSDDDQSAVPRSAPASIAPSDTSGEPALADSEAIDAKPEVSEITSPDAVRQRIADLELALKASIEMRHAAEARLKESEQTVEELEKFVAEIEARGEDPVDYADQGLEKLQPAFFAYQDAFAEFEQAERIEQAARDALAEANAALAGLQ